MEESISLEETNKIRISLGLKPLTDDSAPADDKEKQAETNYAKQREAEAKQKESKRIQDRISKVRNKRELNASLNGATLGDADADTDDTLKWIKKSKKREKELAKKRQAELESMDKVFQEEYTEKDLEGLKVSHDFSKLEDGESHILTLKDSRILDNEDDELQNVEMAEAEKTKERNELKIKKRDYTGYDDEEFVEGREGMRRTVLSKYDEFLEGPKDTGFRLGSSLSSYVPSAQSEEQTAVSVNKALLSIDYTKNIESSDYLQKGDVGFKKPKTKKKRPTRRAAEDSDIIPVGDQMEIDIKPSVPRVRDLDVNFVDDDELQAALASSRRAKIKIKKVSPEEIARRVAEERARSEEPSTVDVIKVEDGEAEVERSGGLVFDDTSEFVRGITYDPIVVKREVPGADGPVTPAMLKQASPYEDIPMEEAEELEAGEVLVKDEDEDDDAMLNAIEDAIRVTEAEEKAAAEDGILGVGTSSEQTFSTGMASTLNILRQQGLLATPSDDQVDRERVQLQRDLWLAEQRRRVAQREIDRLKARGSNKDQAQREYENRLRDQQEARANLEAFKNYKPDVNIVYHDEFGRALDWKEAWKALSHKFHGKGSGKMKTEKRLKKIAEEKKKEAMASGDTPLSMNKAFQIRQEKTGQAHFVLSVGNRGAVPQVAEFLDAQPLSKGKTEKVKSKKKDASKSTNKTLDNGFMTVPAPQAAYSGSASASPAPSLPGTETGSPAPRPGFSRIASTVVSDVAAGSGTPVSIERSRVAFGFSAKRKAGEEASGTPPPKSARH
ncbi:SART-1 family-domain-containing protein [Lactarius akahatsu]|uniref:SART-1 family-domain-containing protein n=1 Tax=Lactarius akahatsu TaxID=416441 RepID=A0AAD4LKA2_9AGAM|nr:SART-1 family-domain-containing protein [Lactarius akahatsu]